jgi:hypothetical protein
LLDPQTEKGYPTRFAPLLARKGFSPSQSQWVPLSPAETDKGSYEADELLAAPLPSSTTDRAAEKRNSGAQA